MWLLFDHIWFLVLSRRLHFFRLKVLHQFLIPAHKVDVTVEITASHHVAKRSFTFCWEYNHVCKVPQLGLVDCFEQP